MTLVFKKGMNVYDVEDMLKEHLGSQYGIVEAKKKPIAITCVLFNEDFIVETLEGQMKGKKGDVLMIGVNGEMYPCDGSIFRKTYDIIPDNK